MDLKYRNEAKMKRNLFSTSSRMAVVVFFSLVLPFCTYKVLGLFNFPFVFITWSLFCSVRIEFIFVIRSGI